MNLFKAIIEAITLPGEIVLDQFAGSGNLGIAASNLLWAQTPFYGLKAIRTIPDF